MPRFSKASESRLETCHPDLRRLFREVVKHFDCSILEGVRTEDRQQELFAQGRTEPGSIVTYCDGITRKSNHQAKDDGWSHAVDAAPYFAEAPHIRWKDENSFYRFAGFVEAIAYNLGVPIKWGGDFKKLKDLPHWELDP